ncbi:MAG: hypothetical protein ABIR38_06755 [Chthoniobacterales bacterium]
MVQANAADTAIALYCPGYTPPASARLNIPSHGIEKDITSTIGLAGYRRFNFSSAIGTGVGISSTGIEGQSGVAYVITAFMTRRSAYAVVRSSGLSSAFAGELRFYPDNNTANYEVVTRNLVSATPFTIPLTAGGGLQNRYVAAVNPSTAEPQFNRGLCRLRHHSAPGPPRLLQLPAFPLVYGLAVPRLACALPAHPPLASLSILRISAIELKSTISGARWPSSRSGSFASPGVQPTTSRSRFTPEPTPKCPWRAQPRRPGRFPRWLEVVASWN